MIELLLAADRLLADGELDRAERIYGQVVEADPRNAIAFVGLARVAFARGDLVRARATAHDALAVDPDDVAAQGLAAELGRVAARPSAGLPAGPGLEPLPAVDPAPADDLAVADQLAPADDLAVADALAPADDLTLPDDPAPADDLAPAGSEPPIPRPTWWRRFLARFWRE